MLQDIRANSQGTIAKVIIGLIVISFSIFGIKSLLFSGGSTAVAEVNGEEITPFALQQEISVQQRQLLSLLGDDADPALLDEAAMTQRALQTLIQREIIRQAAESMDMSTSDEALGQIIASMEQFQIDGRFSRDMFQSSLAAAGFTPALFRERLAQDVQVGQLRAGVVASDFATPRELDIAARIAREARDVRYATLSVDSFRADVEVDEEAVAAYYEANQERYRSEESVDVDYVELDLDDYRQPVSEERLREEFELVRDEFEVPEEARVSHILVEEGDDEALGAAIEALESGTPFAEVAREYSIDIGSAAAGGDLGYTAGDTFPDAMEEAIAQLEEGERSGPVATEAGTHILLVTDRREGTAVAFEDVRAELEDRIQRAEAGDALLLDVERLRDIAFNAADLAPPAEELGLTIQTAEGVTRSTGEGPFADARVREAAFSPDVLEQRHNSEVIELDRGRFIALHVRKVAPAATLPLAEVRPQILADLTEAAARDAARAAAEDLLRDLETGTSMEAAAQSRNVDWQVELGALRQSTRLPPAVRDRLFSLPPPQGDAPRLAIVDGAGSRIYVLEFTRRNEGSLDDYAQQERRQLQQRIAGETGGLLQQQFESALRERADVVIY
jgi:peptidyl-prolyl cis-trans isomerase D